MNFLQHALFRIENAARQFDWQWLRLALYGGLLSSVGVTLGWFCWIAFEILAYSPRRWEVLEAAAIGTAVGLLVEFLREYREIARVEAGLVTRAEEKEEDEARAFAPQFLLAARTGAFVVGALGLVCEHLASDLIQHILVPFITSLALLVPAGMLLTLLYYFQSWRGWKIDAVAYRIFIGVIAGVGVSILIFGVSHLIGGVSLSWWSLAGWWVLLGIGFALAGFNANNPFAPFVGALLAIALVVLVARWPASGSTIDSETPNPIAVLQLVVQGAAANALRDSALPSQYAQEAENLTSDYQADQAKSAKHPVTQPLWARDLCRWVGCPVNPAPVSLPSIIPHNGDQFRSPIGTYPGDDLQATSQRDRQLEAAVDARSRLCADLQGTGGATLVRSWLIMIFFSVGLGVAIPIEEYYRPAFYDQSSRVFWYDWILIAMVSILMVTAVVLGHHGIRH